MAMESGKGLGLKELIMILFLFLILAILIGYPRLSGMIMNLSGIGLGFSLLYIGYRLENLLRGSREVDSSDEGLVSDNTHDIAYQVKPGHIRALGNKNHDYQVNRLSIR